MDLAEVFARTLTNNLHRMVPKNAFGIDNTGAIVGSVDLGTVNGMRISQVVDQFSCLLDVGMFVTINGGTYFKPAVQRTEKLEKNELSRMLDCVANAIQPSIMIESYPTYKMFHAETINSEAIAHAFCVVMRMADASEDRNFYVRQRVLPKVLGQDETIRCYCVGRDGKPWMLDMPAVRGETFPVSPVLTMPEAIKNPTGKVSTQGPPMRFHDDGELPADLSGQIPRDTSPIHEARSIAESAAAAKPPESREAIREWTDKAISSNTDRRKHSHYFKDVSHLDTIDVYRVLQLFNVTDQALGHAIKKLLVAGGRGAGKDISRDVAEAVDTLQRWQELRDEEVDYLKNETNGRLTNLLYATKPGAPL